MGIHNLHVFLRKMCPHVYQKIPLYKYAFKKIAIDLSIFLCKFKTTYGNNWLDAFLHLMIVLRRNDIHFLFVYDSKAPPEKDEERRLRSEARAKNKDRIMKLQQLWDQYKHDHTCVDLDSLQHEANALLPIVKKVQSQFVDSVEVSIQHMDNELQRLQNTIFTITSEDFELTKELFRICRVPVMIAAGEAEATCAALNRAQTVSAVLTDDTDVLAYGSPIMLHRIQLEDECMIEIDYQEVIRSLGISSSQFVDFCIMCGTDYNPNLPKIGPDRSLKLIRQYQTLEQIEENIPSLPMHLLNYKRVRQIFSMKIGFDVEHQIISFCGFPDENRLRAFLFTNNLKTNIQDVVSAFCTSTLHRFICEEDEVLQSTEKKKSNLLLLNN